MTTSGLVQELERDALSFGTGAISTSNSPRKDVDGVIVKCLHPILWMQNWPTIFNEES